MDAYGKPIAWEATNMPEVITDDHINELINTALESTDLQNEADAIDSLTELGFVNPIADENNTIYTDDNNTIYSL